MFLQRQSAFDGVRIDPDQALHDECAGDVAAADTAEIVGTELYDGNKLLVQIGLQIRPGLTGDVEVSSGSDGCKVVLQTLIHTPASPGSREKEVHIRENLRAEVRNEGIPGFGMIVSDITVGRGII